MPTYANGYIPQNLLIRFKDGYDSVGYWYHELSAATYARHLALVRRALRRTNRVLQIGEGFNAYRPYAAQVLYKKKWGLGAATPGTSSHGGLWEGKQTLAMDYSNWGEVYNWDMDAFFADARAVGLTPNMITKARGYASNEPWHVIDLNPWGPVPSFEDATPLNETEDDEMVKPFFDNAQRIYWPNGFYNVYDKAVYNALKYYYEDKPGNEQPGTEGTVAREVWAANNYMINLNSKATAVAVSEAIKAAGLGKPVDVQAIANAVDAVLQDDFAKLQAPKA